MRSVQSGPDTRSGNHFDWEFRGPQNKNAKTNLVENVLSSTQRTLFRFEIDCNPCYCYWCLFSTPTVMYSYPNYHTVVVASNVITLSSIGRQGLWLLKFCSFKENQWRQLKKYRPANRISRPSWRDWSLFFVCHIDVRTSKLLYVPLCGWMFEPDL